MKLSRVHPFEWLVGLIGLVMLVGLITNVSSPGVLHTVVMLVAAAGVVLPFAVAMSARTNVPIVYETLLWTVSGLVVLVLVIRALVPSDSVFESGWLALAGMVAMSFSLWRSVDRER